MKKLLGFGIAAVIAAGSLTVATGAASAKPYWKYPKYPMAHTMPNPWGGQGYWPGRISGPGGFFFGFNLGSPGFYPNPYPREYYPRQYPRNNYGVNSHVQWCLSRYRTYNPATNLYFKKRGVQAVCVSPFRY